MAEHTAAPAERYAVRWAASGEWQWKEFDSREALLEALEKGRAYLFDPEWSRGTQVWRLDNSVFPPAVTEEPTDG